MPCSTAKELRSRWKPDVRDRELKLHRALVVSANWEVPTHDLIAALQKKPPKKNVSKKRVGCRDARRLEQLDRVNEILSAEEKTMFRAVSARAMYLSVDRSDIMFAAKERCRESAET